MYLTTWAVTAIFHTHFLSFNFHFAFSCPGGALAFKIAEIHRAFPPPRKALFYLSPWILVSSPYIGAFFTFSFCCLIPWLCTPQYEFYLKKNISYNSIMNCNIDLHNEILESGEVTCPFCNESLDKPKINHNYLCCESENIINDNGK